MQHILEATGTVPDLVAGPWPWLGLAMLGLTLLAVSMRLSAASFRRLAIPSGLWSLKTPSHKAGAGAAVPAVRPRQTSAPPQAEAAAGPPSPQHDLDRVLKALHAAEVTEYAAGKPAGVRCRMDLAATRDGLELTMELPGLDERGVQIEVVNDCLTISGELTFGLDHEGKNFRLTERNYGAFARTVDLPAGVRPDRIKASMNRGVLTVLIPNPSKPEPRSIEVQTAPAQLIDTERGLELTIEAPGLTESDIEVAVSGGMLMVRCVRPVAPGAHDSDTRQFRSVEVPEGVNVDHISAVLSKGVLKVAIPYPTLPNPRRIDVRTAA